MGPVNDHLAYKKITEYFEVGLKEGKLLIGGTANNEKGYFIDPTVFYDLKPNSRLMKKKSLDLS